jgi:integrase
MSSIRKLKAGRYQADCQDRFRGIPRTKRTFKTRKEGEEWLDAVRREGHARLLGHKRRHLFGEALARYLREESPKKKTHYEDLLNAKTLRWPIWDDEARRWLRLEETPLDEVPTVLARWIADLKAVVRRGYVGSQLYHKRRKGHGTAWFHQPDPNEGEQPAPRAEVTDPALIAALDDVKTNPGRGPFNSATLRLRQLLVSRILFIAWKHWSVPGNVWLDQNIAGKIMLEDKGQPRQQYLTYDQLLTLLIVAPIHFDDAILAAAWIGWRRGNVVGRAARGAKADGTWHRDEVTGLEWPNVVFPVLDGDRLVQGGYFYKDRKETKNGEPLVQPMSDRVEQLLRLRWDLRDGRVVFHRGDGKPFLEFRKMWATAKRRAGIDPGFRWHDLRHTFASELFQAGANDRHVQELLGHADIGTTQKIYINLRFEHLRDAVNAPGNKRMN